jgi:hypothetical protein
VVWGRRRKRDTWGQHRVKHREPGAWTVRHDEATRLVSDALWTAAHERLDQQRAVYLRHQDGRLWGRPTNDKESPYLLPGFAACGICSAALYVRSGEAPRGIGRPKRGRRYSYLCQVHHHRGAAVCINSSRLPLEATEAAVLEALNTSVLNPAVVERMLRDGAARQRAQLRQHPEIVTTRRAQLAEIDAQLERLTAAIAQGAGTVPTVVKQLRTLQRERDRMAEELAGLTASGEPFAWDTLRRLLEARLPEWRDAMRRNVQQARQLLRRLLVRRLVFTPTAAGVEFRGQATIGHVLGRSRTPMVW